MGRLLAETSSYELSEWQTFLSVDKEVRDELAKRAREDAKYLQGE